MAATIGITNVRITSTRLRPEQTINKIQSLTNHNSKSDNHNPLRSTVST